MFDRQVVMIKKIQAMNLDKTSDLQLSKNMYKINYMTQELL